MPYAPLDEHFDEHPKYEDLELDHYGLMACAITYCNRLLTDGFVSERVVRGFGKSGKGLRVANKLVEKGIWKRVELGFQVVGFLDHNPPKEEVLRKREGARLRKESQRKRDIGETVTRDGQRDSRGDSHVTSRACAITALHCTTQTLQDPPNPQGAVVGESPPSKVAPDRVVDLGTARCEDVCQVYVATLGEASWLRADIRERWERQSLCDAINTHLRADGSIDGVRAELKRAIREWVDTNTDKPQFTSGWSVRKFGEWLATGRKTNASTLVTRRALPPLEDDDRPSEPMSADERAEVEAMLKDQGFSDLRRDKESA